MERGTVRWWIVVGLVPFATMVGSVATLVAFGGRLPDPLAVHWTAGGPPNGSMSFAVYLGVVVLGLGIPWAFLIAGSRRSMPSAPLAGVTYFVLGLFAAVTGQIIAANLDAERWTDAASTTLLGLVVLLGVGAAAGAVGWFAAGGSAGVPADEPMEEVAATGVAWTGSASNGWMAAVGIAPLLFVPILPPLWWVLLAIVAVLGLVFSTVRVTVDGRAVCVALGPFGRPQRCLATSTIAGVTAVRVQPMAYGGWGYRVRSGVRGYIVRGGPALRIERIEGAAVVVTVQDAPAGAAAIAAAISGVSPDQDADGEERGEREL